MFILSNTYSFCVKLHKNYCNLFRTREMWKIQHKFFKYVWMFVFRVYDTIASVDHFTMSSKKTSAVILIVYIDKNNKYAFIIYAKYYDINRLLWLIIFQILWLTCFSPSIIIYTLQLMSLRENRKLYDMRVSSAKIHIFVS